MKEVETNFTDIFGNEIKEGDIVVDVESDGGIIGENGYELEDQITWEEFNAEDNELKLVYLEGAFYNEKTLTEIRNTISNGKN